MSMNENPEEEYNMNKTELVAAMAEKAQLSKKDAEAALNAFTGVVAEELNKGEIKILSEEEHE